MRLLSIPKIPSHFNFKKGEYHRKKDARFQASFFRAIYLRNTGGSQLYQGIFYARCYFKTPAVIVEIRNYFAAASACPPADTGESEGGEMGICAKNISAPIDNNIAASHRESTLSGTPKSLSASIIHSGAVSESALRYAGFGTYSAERFPKNIVAELTADIKIPAVIIRFDDNAPINFAPPPYAPHQTPPQSPPKPIFRRYLPYHNLFAKCAQ